MNRPDPSGAPDEITDIADVPARDRRLLIRAASDLYWRHGDRHQNLSRVQQDVLAKYDRYPLHATDQELSAIPDEVLDTILTTAVELEHAHGLEENPACADVVARYRHLSAVAQWLDDDDEDSNTP